MAKQSSEKDGVLRPAQLEAVAAMFAALAEPTRLRILQALEAGPASVGEIIEAAGVKQANASKQLGILFQAGLVRRERDGNVVRYEIAMPLVFDLCALVCKGVGDVAKARAKALLG